MRWIRICKWYHLKNAKEFTYSVCANEKKTLQIIISCVVWKCSGEKIHKQPHWMCVCGAALHWHVSTLAISMKSFAKYISRTLITSDASLFFCILMLLLQPWPCFRPCRIYWAMMAICFVEHWQVYAFPVIDVWFFVCLFPLRCVVVPRTLNTFSRR